jgi:hypothetical protein
MNEKSGQVPDAGPIGDGSAYRFAACGVRMELDGVHGLTHVDVILQDNGKTLTVWNRAAWNVTPGGPANGTTEHPYGRGAENFAIQVAARRLHEGDAVTLVWGWRGEPTSAQRDRATS